MFKLITVFLLLTYALPAYAYIDPATGSMLFSILVGITATLFFVLKAVFYKVSFLTTGYSRHRQKIFCPFVIYSEGKKYWSTFSPILDEFEKRRVPVTFYTSEEDDFVFSKTYQYVKPQYIGNGNKAWMKLSLLSADVCLMTTPGLDVYQLKRSKEVKHYTHVFHGIGDHCDYRLFGLDYYDALMLTTPLNESYIREIEAKRHLPAKELIVAGAPDLDYMAAHLPVKPEKKENFTVLLAASWGPQAILAKYGANLIDKLAATDWDIIIRPHPQMKISEPALLAQLQERYQNNKHIRWDNNPNNMIAMSQADVLISDFSGIIFEYAFLFNKPFVYTEFNNDRPIYDASDLGHPTWKPEILHKIGFELKQDNFENIVSIVQATSRDTAKLAEIQKAKEQIWSNPGRAAGIIADFLIQKQKEITQKDSLC